MPTGTPRRYAPLSAEHRFWVRLFPSFLAPSREPGGLLAAVHGALVVPNVLFVTVSAEYQTYLAVIFHRSWLARIGHILCVPLGVVLLIATAARLAPSLGLAVGITLSVLWTAVGVLHRRPLWATVNAGVGAALTALGLAYPPGWVHPAWLMLGVAALQAGSHATESHVPPRANGAAQWIDLGEALRGSFGALGAIRSWLCGTFDEWWATPRLVHVGTLLFLFRCGYAPELRERLLGYARDAIASGDPALDYIGEGGGSYVDPTTFEPRPRP